MVIPEPDITPTKVRHGAPHPAVAGHLDSLYSFGDREDSYEPASDPPETPISPSPIPLPPTTPPTPVYPEWVPRLVDLTSNPRIPIVIRINGVGLNFNVIAVDKVGTTYCCLIAGEMRCDLPRTNNVELVLDGEAIRVTYLGQWHRFDFLPFHVVCFAAPESEVD